ncbi:tRNA (cytidine(34)-2'-O)-methyltransferase [Pontivivens ytuae]|uniref:tRNA (cytidine(34)-2'-O)-methyltransferase n=1 Tax=Pontivivens ytuae TaxID=2789856 RepID=UPI001E424B0D|nr:tRNA (cytidine(34)-2'-O)-methyltransferase [Pontivivens ytuae]
MVLPLRLASFQPDMAANLGALVRISACFGVPLDVIEPCGFPLSAKALRRAAMDYGQRAEVVRHDDWQQFAASCTGRLVLLTTKGAEPLERAAFRPGDILMTGRESAGVPEEVHAAADLRVAIPMAEGARSLNVAVSAGIALFEARRQLTTDHVGVASG